MTISPVKISFCPIHENFALRKLPAIQYLKASSKPKYRQSCAHCPYHIVHLDPFKILDAQKHFVSAEAVRF